MNRNVCKWLGLGCLVLFALAPVAVSAYSYVMMQDAELFDGAEGVVKARVERVLPAADGDLETRYELSVVEVLAGPSLQTIQSLALPGTFNAPHHNFIVEGVPQLAAGATVLLFHVRRADGALQPYQLSLGLFGREEALVGRGHYVRALEGSLEFGKSAAIQRYHAPRDSKAFERWLVDRGRGVRREPDYLREEISLGTAEKFTFLMFNFNPPGPGRWFQFDSEQSMPWRAGPEGQTGAVTDEFVWLSDALAVWTNDATSRIVLNFAGTQANPGVCNKPQQGTGSYSGHVCWNDPSESIAGAFNGSGTLAFGGSFANSGGQLFNGQTWYPRSDGFVVVQNGAHTFLDGPGGQPGKNGAEVMAHEVGHVLAFGHSCGDNQSPACNTDAVLNAATMRAFAHGDGRGAVLGADDRAAAAIAYPVPGGGDVTPPTAPTNLTATATGSASINTSWNAASDSGGSGLAGYELERCLGAGCNNFAEIREQLGTAFADSGLSAWTTYRYRVRAFDTVGNRSPYSTIAVATTNAAPAMVLSDGGGVANLTSAQEAEIFFTLQVPVGATNLRFQTSGGSGDADLYVRFGSVPTTAINDCKSEANSNAELCTIATPQAGTWHVMLHAFAGYSGLSLTSDFDLPVQCTGDCIFRGGFE